MIQERHMSHTTVLFHSNCPDGYASMFACWQYFGDGAQYIPVSYGQPVPHVPLEHNVFVVDFSYPPDVLQALLAARLGRRHRDEALVVVLDHHASAERDLQSLQRQDLPGLRIHFDLEESGASLAWKWFHTQDQLPDRLHQPDVWAAVETAMPRFFAYVRDRDLWQWRLPDSKAISLAYWALEKTPEAIEMFAQNLDEATGYHMIVTRGQAMEVYAARLVDEQAKRVQWGEIGGYVVPFANTTTLFSEVGEALCVAHTQAPFAAYYFDRGDRRRQWGLRTKGAVDVSVIAKAYGGGGHAAASGFTTDIGWLPPNAESLQLNKATS
jgi:oligoribonuclease NrnB/cAMP/cGMP phosphodiesterase (DHH superfamily)